MIITPPKLNFKTFTIADVPSGHEPFALINKIPIKDNGEPLVDLRVKYPELSFGGYCLPYVRESVAEALGFAIKRVPDHLELRIGTGLRTLEQQAEMYWRNYDKAKEEHPNWPKSTLRKMTNRFFAPPDVKAPPGHCTGGAVDVGLIVRETGESLDVSSPLERWEGAPTAAQGLSDEAAENRRLLCYIMHSSGLSNCRDEFWHWSYGDSAWAVRIDEKVACYGLIEPPEGATRVTGAKLVIVDYNPEWPKQFEELRRAIGSKLGMYARDIVHVGSTSVPGLASKPILDIDIIVLRREYMPKAIELLGELGYEHQGDLGIEGREAFRYDKDDVPRDGTDRKWPAHHLYACPAGSTREVLRHIAFRRYLRENPGDAATYGDIKKVLAEKYPWDRIRYNNEKEPFIVAILKRIDESLLA